jgi:FkbM family methyltransferase
MTAMQPHHEIFRAFPPCGGAAAAGFAMNFLGVRMRRCFWSEEWWDELEISPSQHPPYNEEYFEWIDVLTAALRATDSFTMIELGAGFGRWLLTAAAALRRRAPLPTRLIGVEAEPTHFRWMKQAFRDNGIDPKKHWLIPSAVREMDEETYFATGNAYGWYGQAIVGAPAGSGTATKMPRFLLRPVTALLGLGRKAVSSQKVSGISLSSILRRTDKVDLIDADIQGAEAAVFEPAAERLDAQVKHVHIGTHSAEQENRLRNLFEGMGWRPVFDFPCASQTETPWGSIRFQDGVQSWVNPRFAPCLPLSTAG